MARGGAGRPAAPSPRLGSCPSPRWRVYLRCNRGCISETVVAVWAGAQASRPLLWRPGVDPVMSRRPDLSADARLLVAGQGVRATGYGFTAVLLGALLAARGFTSMQVGVVLTALIAGTALASLAVGRFGDRFGRRRSYTVFFCGLAAAGVVVAAGAPFWVLLVVALTGTLSTDIVDNGPATTLEQAMLATEDAGTAAVYGRYNAVGAAAGALGSLAVILAGLGPHETPKVHAWLFLVLIPVVITGAILGTRDR